MSYCMVQDVEAYYMNKTFNCGDYVENDEILNFISQEAAIMDLSIATRYALPITHQADLLILKTINERLVVGIIDDLIREKASTIQEGELERGRNSRKGAMDLLKQIKEGSLILNSTEKDSVMKFNNKDSDGNVVEKRFKVSDIEPTNETLDRERRTIIRTT